MKYIFSITLVFQVVVSKPLEDQNAKIIKYENVVGIPGNYNFGYETSNGIRHEQRGKLKTSNIVETSGVYSFVAPDHSFHEVHYISDENGYRPQVSSKHTSTVQKPTIDVDVVDRWAPISVNNVNKQVITSLQGRDSEQVKKDRKKDKNKKKDKNEKDKNFWENFWPFNG